MIRRRDFIASIGAAAWPLAAPAQQPSIPVIGFLSTNSLESDRGALSDLRTSLREAGYIEGQNVAIEFRWANGQPILPQLASDLVRLKVAIIVAYGGLEAPLAAKAATSTIPIIIATGADPVNSGLTASLNRPGGNITGITFTINRFAAKRLDLLLKLVPQATTVGYLVAIQGDGGASATYPRNVDSSARSGTTDHNSGMSRRPRLRDSLCDHGGTPA